ncbi:MAG: exosortase, partial [Planctomycetaceae bacterium]
NFHDRAGYLHAVSLYLESERVVTDGYTLCECSSKRLAPVSGGEGIDPGARIYGPVAVSEGTYLARGAVVVGPAVLDSGARVGEDSVIVESVLWNGCKVGAGCEVRGSVIARDAVISDGSIVAEQTVSAGQKTAILRPVARRTAPMGKREIAGGHPGGNMGAPPARVPLSQKQLACILGCGGLVVALLWSYWPVLQDLAKEWQRSDEYSAGLLVPFLAVYVLWTRRRDLVSLPVRPMLFWGVGIFVLCQAMRLFGLFWMYGSAERVSIIVSVIALVLLLFGWRALRRVATVLVFLCLMLPWPHRVQAQISLPLQGWATDSAVFCLELAGYDVLRDGNVIGIGQTNVAVAEACNGLRMVTAFLVISALVVLLVQRTWWEKLIILLSSLPIALFCNTLRLAITAVAFTIIEGDNVEKLFHDFGGYAMMPLALALVVGEFWLLGRLISPQAEVKPAVIVRRRTQHAVDS